MTEISIEGERFYIDGKPTYEGREWNGNIIEGLLLNTRMVQATFDDLNPDTRDRWSYADTGKWDADRNTDEFIAALPSYKAHGVLAVTLNLQGGSPYGYSKDQPWINSAIAPDGTLRAEFMTRVKRILEATDELGMVVILGLYYFGQEKHMLRDPAIVAGVENTARWLLQSGYKNVLVEINNECNINYIRTSLVPENVHKLIDRVKALSLNGHRLLVGTSYGGRRRPGSDVIRSSDFILLHGNGADEPWEIREMIRETRCVEGYTPKPVLINEDDHFDFDQPDNNFIASIGGYTSWGFFDYRMEGEGFDEGYQSVPVNWSISSDRKRGFFSLAKKISGY